MFWKKDKNKSEESPPENILKIPDEFYGAKDPVVHYAKQAAIVQKTNGAAAVANKFQSSVGAPLTAPRLGFLRNKKVIYGLVAAGFLLVVGLIAWYYLSPVLDKPSAPVAVAPEKKPEVIEQPIEETPVEEPVVVEENVVTSTEEIIEPQSLVGQTLQFPTILLANSADIDSDSLTDLEEEIYGTDSGTWDSDGDGYYDGQEVFNLYNPSGIAPMKIIDSGLAKEYVNPIWQYRVYYASPWQVGEVDNEKRAVLFNAITGDYVEIFVSPKNLDETFEDWFAREAVGQSYVDIQSFTNRFQENGWRRNDDLVAYFATDNAVFVMLYNPGVIGSIPFRHAMQMMWQSFRPSKTAVVIPEQMVLPPASTSSEEVAGEIAEVTEEFLP